MTRIVMQTKVCNCRSTASGPRLKLVQELLPTGGIEVTVRVLPFACDRCDTPWTETAHFQEEPRG